MMDFAHARRVMVDTQLRPSGITDRRLLGAFGSVERERFVPANRRDLAYIDDVQAIGTVAGHRFLSAPTPLARLLQLADPREHDRVLDIACGTGYTAALLSGLVAEVVALEEEPALVQAARTALADYANVRVHQGKLSQGAPDYGPYDVIVLEGAVEKVPAAYFEQLAEGGRLVAIVREGIMGVAHVYFRHGGDIATRAEFDASMPALQVDKREETFTF